ncbi:MAG: hypothetical protein V3W18_03090 [candidate division Zixibacteria bacterium]
MNTSGKFMAAGIIAIAAATTGFAGDTIVQIEPIRSDRVSVQGFELLKDGEFEIEAIGFRSGYNDDLSAYGWLLDSKTRKPVWVMESDNTRRQGRKGLRKALKTISLVKGKYEIYYYASGRWSGNLKINGDDIIEFLGDLFKGDFDGDFDDYIDEFFIKISSTDSYKDFKLFEPDGMIEDALIQVNKVGDSEYIEKGFALDKPMKLRIYALSEYPNSYKIPVDHAWIVDAESGKKVWTMDRWNTDPAGGGSKNRYSDEKENFEKGKYLLYYVSDGSHSYDEFNVTPPYDPLNWGVTILAADKSDKKSFSTYTPEGRGDPLVDLARMRDDDFESQAFELKSEQSLRVVALGEYGSSSKDFVDYGWIENASTGRIVWEMTRRNTENAGGASKNRKFDGLVTLPKGYYKAHYITDGSHSYRDWNASAPYEPELWGLSIYPGKDFNKSKFKVLEESELKLSAEILGKMTGLRDNERRRSKFSIDKRTRIRIYAIGEGSRGEMYDYGWIENDKTGRTVWEMTWRNTDPAGGASKNRMFDDTLILDPGKYEVYFITDGSHSFNDWNSSKPRDPVNWGITVSKVEDF